MRMSPEISEKNGYDGLTTPTTVANPCIPEYLEDFSTYRSCSDFKLQFCLACCHRSK